MPATPAQNLATATADALSLAVDALVAAQSAIDRRQDSPAVLLRLDIAGKALDMAAPRLATAGEREQARRIRHRLRIAREAYATGSPITAGPRLQ